MIRGKFLKRFLVLIIGISLLAEQQNIYGAQELSAKRIQGVDTSDIIQLNLFQYDTDNGAENGINQNRTLKFSTSPGTIGQGNPDREDYNLYTGDGKGVYRGIVQNKMENGYPILNVGGQDSLAYLFDESIISDKQRYESNYLFQYEKRSGYYFYDSADTFALLNTSEMDFDNKINQGRYNFQLSSNKKLKEEDKQFFPFGTQSDADKFLFGLNMNVNFAQPENGILPNGEPMQFQFSGDDDMWVFIDDVLVLDLGGIHQACEGSINFATGQIQGMTSLYDAFAAAGYSQNELEQTFEQTESGSYRFKDDTTHFMKVFYLERGGSKSNCKIRFNLQTIPIRTANLTIQKKIDAVDFSQGDPIFAYQIIENKTNKTYYRFVRFTSDEQVGDNGTGVLTQSMNLPMGTYTITELDTLRYRLEQIDSQITSNPSKTVELYSDTTVSFKNVKINDKNFSDTDLLVNHFSVQNGCIVIAPDGLKEEQHVANSDNTIVPEYQ